MPGAHRSLTGGTEMKIYGIRYPVVFANVQRSSRTDFEKLMIQQTQRVNEQARMRKAEQHRREAEHKGDERPKKPLLPIQKHLDIDPLRYSRYLTYKKHIPTNRYYCQVVNASTKQVVREIPPVDELDRIARWNEYIRMLYRH